MEVGALGRDEVPQRVIEIESHTSVSSAGVRRRLSRLGSTPWSADASRRAHRGIAPRASSASLQRLAPRPAHALGAQRLGQFAR